MKPFPMYFQANLSDCGPTCLKMVADYYGKAFNVDDVEQQTKMLMDGSSMLDLITIASILGMKARGFKVTLNYLELITLPAILHWDKCHFVVLYKIQRKRFYVADPSIGFLKLNSQEFMNHWQYDTNQDKRVGIVMVITFGN